MERKPRRFKRYALTALCIVTVAVFAQTGQAPAENGKGNGEPSEELLLLNNRGQTAGIEHGGGVSGAVAPPLRQFNGPVNASAVALERADGHSPFGQARSYRDAAMAEAETEAELSFRRDRLAELGAERTTEAIQAEIDALYPVADADRIAVLERQKAAARTDAQVGADINGTLAEIEALESTRIFRSAETYGRQIGGGNVIEDTVLVLRSALGLN